MLNNQRHEIFAQEYVKNGGNAAMAYRVAYPRSLKWKDESVWTQGSLLLKNPKVLQRVEELQKDAKKSWDTAMEDILGMCRRVIVDGEQIVDWTQTSTGGEGGTVKTSRTISRAWAIERVSKMLGFDKPVKTDLTSGGKPLKREPLVIEVIDSRDKVDMAEEE